MIVQFETEKCWLPTIAQTLNPKKIDIALWDGLEIEVEVSRKERSPWPPIPQNASKRGGDAVAE